MDDTDHDGIHILLDLKDCKANLTDIKIPESIEKKVKEVGLTVITSFLHVFPGENSGYTGYILLGESHVSLHTWPEKNLVNACVYTCNVSGNNEQKCRDVSHYIIELFQSTNYKENVIYR